MDLGRRRRRTLVVLALVFLLHQLLASASVVFKVQHKYGGRGRPLSELRAHDSHRHGRMLAAIDLPLGGNALPTGAALYFTKIGLGTPSKDYYVQVDTGSDILWVNCAGCDKCPTKSGLGIELKQFNPKESSTATTVTCDQDFCTYSFNGPYSNCKVGQACEYAVTYGDGSQTAGFYVTDNVVLDRVTGNSQTAIMNGSISFGCAAKQSGDLGSSSQAVDGIIGFGQQNTSMISQLASAGKVKKMFSHCLDGNNGGGIFAIGEVVQPKVKSTPLVPNQPHYNVNMKEVEVDGQVLNLPTDVFDTGDSSGTIIDSGTTLAYLPDAVYNPLIVKVMARQPDIKTHLVEQQFKCFYYTGNVDDGFPVVTFHFENSLPLTVYPHDYLFQTDKTEWCIGWQNSQMQSKDGKEITLLGDLALTNKLVLYDIENQTIGWIPYNCSSSIRVKDEESKKVYTISAHDVSSAYSLIAAKILTLLLLTAILNLIC